MKKILVPCDFSLPSKAAYKSAMNFAAQTDGEVVVLHVSFIPIVYDGLGAESMAFSPDYFTSLEKEVKNQFEKMRLEVGLSAVKSRLELIYGNVLSSIMDFVKTHQMDMIIMGASGISGIEEILIGSNTEKVVRHSPVPVLVVTEYVNISSVQKILFPTLLNLDQTDFIKKLKELQSFSKATIHVLYVNTPGHFTLDSDAKEAYDEFVKQYKLENCEFHFRNFRSEEEGIIDFAFEKKMELIAMGTHARKGLAHLFNGSIAEGVVKHIASPVWTYCLKREMVRK